MPSIQADDREEGEMSTYREIERNFWAANGLAVTERFVEAGPARTRLRVQEVGTGTPVLFVHGTGGPGAYFAPLLRELDGVRAIVIDRPGWGSSDPVEYTGSYGQLVARMLRDVLDALDIDRAHVAGASIGDLWALRLAQAEPTRVDRIVLLGGGPLTAAVKVPTFIKLLRGPVGNIIVRLPEKPNILRKQLAAFGHAASLETGRIGDTYIDWHVAMSRMTGWAKPERDMVRAIIRRDGFAPGLVLTDDELTKIDHPTLMIFGTADPTGSRDIWDRFTGTLPNGRLHLVQGGGHVVWLDDPAGVAREMKSFLGTG